MTIHEALNIGNKIGITAATIFPLTTAYMLLILRLNGENPILTFARSKFSVSFDLKLFGYMRQRYTEIKKGRLIPFLNLTSWYVFWTAFIVNFILQVVDMTR
jgi:hypothetical protein